MAKQIETKPEMSRHCEHPVVERSRNNLCHFHHCKHAVAERSRAWLLSGVEATYTALRHCEHSEAIQNIKLYWLATPNLSGFVPRNDDNMLIQSVIANTRLLSGVETTKQATNNHNLHTPFIIK